MQQVYSGGVASGSIISAGGKQGVIANGRDTGSIVASGGLQAVSSGGTSDATFVSASGCRRSPQLALDNLAAFAAHIGGFSVGDEIALGGFAYGGGETRSFVEAGSHTSGTLSVNDGTKHATLTLLGNYVTSDFLLSNNGAGGTLIRHI